MQTKRKYALLLILLTALFAAVILGAIALIPFDAPEQAPANSSGNLMNGGYAAKDGGLLYYIDENGGLVCRTEQSTYRITESGCDLINPYNSTVIYRRDGKIMQSNFTGSGTRVLVEDVQEMLVIGNWIYFTDSSGTLCKTKIGSGKITSLNLRPAGPFTVSGTSVFFIGDKGYLYTAQTDGTNVEPFLGEPVSQFMMHDSHIFYLSSGKVCATLAANSASKSTFAEADEFIVLDTSLVYIKDGALYSLEYENTDAKPVKVETGVDPVTRLNACDGRLYCFGADGVPYSMRKDGSERQALR